MLGQTASTCWQKQGNASIFSANRRFSCQKAVYVKEHGWWLKSPKKPRSPRRTPAPAPAATAVDGRVGADGADAKRAAADLPVVAAAAAAAGVGVAAAAAAAADPADAAHAGRAARLCGRCRWGLKRHPGDEVGAEYLSRPLTLELPPLKLQPVATSLRWESSTGAVGWRAKDGISWAMALVAFQGSIGILMPWLIAGRAEWKMHKWHFECVPQRVRASSDMWSTSWCWAPRLVWNFVWPNTIGTTPWTVGRCWLSASWLVESWTATTAAPPTRGCASATGPLGTTSSPACDAGRADIEPRHRSREATLRRWSWRVGAANWGASGPGVLCGVGWSAYETIHIQMRPKTKGCLKWMKAVSQAWAKLGKPRCNHVTGVIMTRRQSLVISSESSYLMPIHMI